MITRHLHCSVEPEPAGFHTGRTFSVNLGVEAMGFVPPADTEKDDAREWFEQALEFFGKVSFKLLRWDDGTSVWTDTGKTLATTSETPAASAVGDTLTWLDESGASWLSQGSDETVDAETAPATYRLRAAQCWSAPVGHRLGLTHLVKLPDTTEPHAILPVPKNASLVSVSGPKPGSTTDLLSLEVTFEIDGAQPSVTCHTRAIDNSVVTPSSDDVSSDGYLKVDKDAEIVWRMVDWLQTRSGSVFAASTALLNIARDRSNEDPPAGHFDIILEKTRNAEDTDDEKAAAKKAVVWFCATHLCAALDPLILGLIGPVASSGAPTAPGGLIAPFVNDLADRGMADTELRLDPEQILTAVNAVVRSRLPTVQTFSPPKELFEWLQGAYSLREDYAHVLALLETSDDDVAAFDKAFGDDSAETMGETILRELNQIEQMLQDEGGAEEVLLGLLGGDFPGEFSTQHIKKHPQLSSEQEAEVRKHVEQAWKDYDLLINGPFNAAEAARKAVSREFARAAMDAAKKPALSPMDTPEGIRQVMDAADFFHQRAQEKPTGCFDKMIEALPRLKYDAQNKPISDLLADLKAAWAEPIKQITDLHASLAAPDKVSFTPDLAPAPLPIQIAASLSAEDALAFATDYNGIAVCIRRVDDPNAGAGVGWAHANLAKLEREAGSGSVTPIEPRAIVTSYPAVSDGSGPMFLNYEGRPFVLPVAETVKKGAKPFYIADLPDDLGGFARIPELAYGRTFETFAFVTTNAGTLPTALRLSEEQPWLPKPDVTPPDATLIGTTHCQRRTAIGRTEIIEPATTGRTRRLGAGVPGVHLLALDYPGQVSSQNPKEPDAPLLLLAPQGDVWQRDLQEEVRFVLSAPRVTFRDFERWFANKDLFAVTFGTNDANGKLLYALKLINELRELDPRIGPLIDRMPDPAVAELSLELRVTDSLVSGDWPTITAPGWSLAGLVGDFAKDFKTAIDDLEDQIKAGDPNIKEIAEIIVTRLLRPLDQLFCTELTVSAGAKAGDLSLAKQPGPRQRFVVKVPAGHVARLSVDARVPAGHFEGANSHPATINPGITRFARPATEDNHYPFPSAAMRIEVMFDGLGRVEAEKVTLVDKMIALRPGVGTHSYRVETRAVVEAEQELLWRLIGEIDVATQRWRPTGRPLYHRINPTDVINEAHDLTKRPDTAAALPLSLTDAVSAFETDAFLDRSPSDYLLSLPQKVSPLGSGTVLLEQSWTDASATYFRHRFILRSRYAGAMRTSRSRQVEAWVSDHDESQSNAGASKYPQSKAWTHRVAMRAELSQLELTRPQLRALIPLTTAPSDADSVPPVMAVLQERPFDRGGLADLVLAEIKTGFGFGFPEQNQPLAIVDSRKEIGPDPRLTYSPVASLQATGLTLSAEGIAGLTFDPENASAPAFPNAMMLLSPVSMRGDALDLTEHHLAVQLWRTLLPGWVFPKVTGPSGLSPDETWWIEVDAGHVGDILMVEEPQSAGAPPTRPVLLTAQEKDGFRVLYLNPKIIDPVGGTKDTPIPIASWSPSKLTGPLVILHRPASAGRCLTSILGKMQASDKRIGEGVSTVVLASFEWSVQAGARLLPGPTTRPPVRTSASGATSLTWTRTSTDADKVAILRADQGEDIDTIAVADLAGVLSPGSLSFRRTGDPTKSCVIVPSLLGSNVPLHVQRHLAVLLTSQLDGPGRPVETFHEAALLFGESAMMQDTDLAKVRRNPFARIVEFETPAVILCRKEATAVPAIYRNAYLDLMSHRPSRVEYDWQVRFLLRFNIPPSLARNDHTLKLEPAAAEGGQVGTLAFNFIRAKDKADSGVRAAAITITGKQGTIAKAEAHFLHETGEISSPEFTPTSGGDPGVVDGLTVTMSVPGDTDVWADLSALWSWRGQKQSSFDFDWLFGPPRDPSVNPERQVGPAALAEMREAQARIISTSPPIPVRRTP